MHLLRQYKRDDASFDIFVGAAGLSIQLRDNRHSIHWNVRGYPISFVEAIREVCGSSIDATGTVEDIPQTSAEFAFVTERGDESEWVRAYWQDSDQIAGGWQMLLRTRELRQIADLLHDYWVI